MYSKDDRFTPVFLTKSSAKDESRTELVVEEGAGETTEDSAVERSVDGSVKGSVGGGEESVEVVSEPIEGQDKEVKSGTVSEKEAVDSDEQASTTDKAVGKMSVERASLQTAAASATESDSDASNTGLYLAIAGGVILLVVAGLAIYRARRT